MIISRGVFVGILLACCYSRLCQALVNSDKNIDIVRDDGISRRGWLWKAPVGAVGTYAYGRLLYNALSADGIQYPSAHEDRVASTVAATIATSAVRTSPAATSRHPLRVLEVGIGTEARLIRRGLYDPAIRQVSEKIPDIELVGLDFRLPNANVQSAAEAKLKQVAQTEGVNIFLQLLNGSLTEKQLHFRDGYFDAIVCCLTLCSVDDPEAAVSEIRRLLRPTGGAFGYVEHVAVGSEDKSHRLLDWQQQLLDPLQQRLVENCHLHRFTESTVASGFGVERNESRVVQEERFFVPNMWPVSCQSSGVIQRI